MSILPGRHRSQPATPIAGRCDRCGGAAHVRVGKHIATLHEYAGQPHAVDTRELDLLMCGRHYTLHQAALSARGWRVIEAAR